MRPLTERQERVLVAMRELGGLGISGHPWYTARRIADRAKIGGDIRHGNGAVKGSWSGTTSPALAVANTLRGLVKRGLVEEDRWGIRSHRPCTLYKLTEVDDDAQ